MSTLKIRPTHAVVANAPIIIATVADDPVTMIRQFIGLGAPSATTLFVGNGKYCAANSGFVIDLSLVNGGAGYAAGQLEYIQSTGGVAISACLVAIDSVGATGNIIDWHVANAGNYSTYPTSPIALISGGATFNIGYQPADRYLDMTNPLAPVEYVCTTAGTNSTSVWAKISGGGGGGGESVFVITTLSNADYFVARTWDGVNVGTTDVYIAKGNRFRTSLTSETVDGVGITFSSYTSDNQRIASDGTNTEIELVYPRYVTMTTEGFTTIPVPSDTRAQVNLSRCRIRATQPAGGTGVSQGGNPVTWEECSPYRVWVRPFGS